MFAILPDGTDIELHFVRESELDRVRSGPHRVLVDDRGVLTGVTFPWPEFDRATQTQELRKVVMWFWHDLSHFAAAIDRGHLWWAAGQLEALRAYCVRLARVEHGAEPMSDEPYWKLDAEMPTAPLELDPFDVRTDGASRDARRRPNAAGVLPLSGARDRGGAWAHVS